MDDNEVIVSSSQVGRSKYHTSDCQFVKQMQKGHGKRTIPKQEAERMGLEECGVCANGYQNQGKKSTSHLDALKRAAENND